MHRRAYLTGIVLRALKLIGNPIAAGADDLSLPKATVQKIITEILQPSPGVTFAKDARDLLIDCCVEFITLISSEANEIAEKEAKKTIATEHIDKALRELGFPEYVQEVLASAGEHKEALKVFVSLAKTITVARLRLSRHGKRKRTRWTKAGCRKRSYCDSRRSFLNLRQKSTTRGRPRVKAVVRIARLLKAVRSGSIGSLVSKIPMASLDEITALTHGQCGLEPANDAYCTWLVLSKV